MINVIGDSHSLLYKLPLNYRTFYLGPVTMHRIGRDGLDSFGIGNSLKPGEVVIFVFGEIDARCHILKQSQIKHTSVNNVVDDLVSRYIQQIHSFSNKYEIKPIVQLVVPPAKIEIKNPKFPPFGTLSERAEVYKSVNRKIRYYSQKLNIKNIDLSPLSANPKGHLKKHISERCVHISPKKYFLYEPIIMGVLPEREKDKLNKFKFFSILRVQLYYLLYFFINKVFTIFLRRKYDIYTQTISWKRVNQ